MIAEESGADLDPMFFAFMSATARKACSVTCNVPWGAMPTAG
jgi:hypothetical protein